MIAPINSLTPAAGMPGAPDRAGDGMFGQVFRSAIENVRETEADKTQTQYLLATGQLDNPAVVSIASSKNEIAVDLLVQLRNKTMDAYSELMRISL